MRSRRAKRTFSCKGSTKAFDIQVDGAIERQNSLKATSFLTLGRTGFGVITFGREAILSIVLESMKK